MGLLSKLAKRSRRLSKTQIFGKNTSSDFFNSQQVPLSSTTAILEAVNSFECVLSKNGDYWQGVLIISDSFVQFQGKSALGNFRAKIPYKDLIHAEIVQDRNDGEGLSLFGWDIKLLLVRFRESSLPQVYQLLMSTMKMQSFREDGDSKSAIFRRPSLPLPSQSLKTIQKSSLSSLLCPCKTHLDVKMIDHYFQSPLSILRSLFVDFSSTLSQKLMDHTGVQIQSIKKSVDSTTSSPIIHLTVIVALDEKTDVLVLATIKILASKEDYCVLEFTWQTPLTEFGYCYLSKALLCLTSEGPLTHLVATCSLELIGELNEFSLDALKCKVFSSTRVFFNRLLRELLTLVIPKVNCPSRCKEKSLYYYFLIIPAALIMLSFYYFLL